MEALRDGDCSVNELVDAVDIGQPGVSRQLAILHQAGFVGVRPDGRRRIYSLRPEPFQALDRWMEPYRRVLQERFANLDQYLERMKKDV